MKLWTTFLNNISFVLISVVLMLVVFLFARGSEILIEKKTGMKFSSEKTKINRMVLIAMFSAISVVLMYFEFPVVAVAPSFYKMDFSEIPALIGSFMLGPCAGVIIEAVKILLHLFLKGTSTVFVGEFANFILGAFYIVPAAIIYHMHKTRRMAIVSLIIGGLVLIISGTLMNAWYLLPKYSELYGIPVQSFIEMGSKINGSITDVFTFVALAVAPFNLIKAVADGFATTILYKYLSRHLKG